MDWLIKDVMEEAAAPHDTTARRQINPRAKPGQIYLPGYFCPGWSTRPFCFRLSQAFPKSWSEPPS